MKVNYSMQPTHTSEAGLLLAVVSLMSIIFDHFIANLGNYALSIGIISGCISIFINIPKVVTTIKFIGGVLKRAFNRFK